MVHLPRPHHLLALVAVLGVAPLVIWNGVSDNSLLPQYLAWCLGLLVTGAAFWGRGDAGRMVHFPKILFPLLAFVLWAGLACTWTRNPWEGLFEWSKYAFSLSWAVFLGWMALRDNAVLRWIPRVLALTAAAALGLGYTQLALAGIAEQGLSHFITYRVDAFFSHRNLFAEALVMLLPFLSILVLTDRGLWRTLGLVLALLALLMVMLLQVRSAWLALAASGAVTLLGAVLARRGQGGSPIRWRPILLVGSLVLVTVLGGGYFYSRSKKAHGLTEVGTSILRPTYGSAKERLVMWEKTCDLIAAHPVRGVGVNGWRVEFPGMGYGNLRKEVRQGKVMVDRTHNDFLQVTAETGLPGGLLWVATLLLPVLAGIRAVDRIAEPRERWLVLAPIGSLTAFVVISVFSFPMERISHMILLGTQLATLGALVPVQRQLEVGRWPRRLAVVGVMLLACAGAFVGWKRLQADRMLMEGLARRETRDWAGMLAAMEAGDTRFTCLDPTGTPFRWYMGSARHQLGDYPGALKDFQSAYLANPNHLHVLNNLGATWVQLGEPDSGAVYCERAARLSPIFSEAWTNLGILEYNRGRRDRAEMALLMVQDSMPGVLTERLASTLIRDHLRGLGHTVADSALRASFSYMSESPTWQHSVFMEARRNGRPLRIQILLDGIYALEMSTNGAKFGKGDSLRKIYLPPHFSP